ncbi:C-type mannose receptor 2-like [Sander vitreus]
MVKMQWSLFVLIVMVSSLLSGQCSSIGGQLYDYYFIGENMTWKDAQKYCRTHHTDLATVSNQTDMLRLLNSTTAQYQAGAWIGLQENTPNNSVWRWSQSGVEFNESESEWSQGQPDNGDNQENCVMMTVGTWDDDSCTKRYNFICYDEKTWLEAQSYCREHHTDLISGVKQLKDFKRQHQKIAGPFWIGLFRDSWNWSDGSSFSFRSWEKNKPNPKKTCAMTMSDGKWRADDCDETKPFFCYNDSVILIKENMTWVDALYYCRAHHHDLVSITNLDEQRWVQERAKMASTQYLWLGLRYTCTLDLWFWVTDETVCYTNWGPGQPEDDCTTAGAMNRQGTWVKKHDDHQLNFICSK